MEQNNERNSRKRLNSLILLVAFTAIMLIVSTYAWFSTQKNVTLGGLQGKVNVAEGLQISLDAKTWKNEIDFSSFTQTKDEDTGVTTWTSSTYLPGATLNTPYAGGSNVLPDELLPASTTGTGDDAVGLTKMNLYRGLYEDEKLADIKTLAEERESGFYAIDFFLWNTSAAEATVDPLQLETNSSFAVLSTDKASTGLQNTGRIALAQYAVAGDDTTNGNLTPTVDQIIAGTSTGKTITDVAIWEPNANAHVQFIIDNNNNVKFKNADVTAVNALLADSIVVDGVTGVGKFKTTSQIPTYALNINAVGKVMPDIYDWSGTGLIQGTEDADDDGELDTIAATPAVIAKQNTLQTTTDGVTAKTQLVSTSNGTTAFTIPASSYVKMRMYIWLEGQDVDCINYASLGGGVKIDLGICKPGSQTEDAGGEETP